MNERYSLHKIYEKDSCSFSEEKYSRFKFGDISCAEIFGEELFNGFIKEYKDKILAQNEIIMLPSPYHSIPTASNYLCYFFKKRLNHFLYLNEKKACIDAKIHRNQTYIQDYGSMDYEERIRLISGDTYHIDKDFVNGKFCIFVDDIKITGSHEHTVNKILDKHNISGDFVFVYYAELMNHNIHPNIENYYNYFAIRSLGDIISIINNKSFAFNTRIVKYILNMKDGDFNEVINNISKTKVEELFFYAISNNYHLINDYKNNIYKIQSHGN